MIKQQKRHSSKQMINSKKPIKPMEITLRKKNDKQKENCLRGSSHAIQISTKINVHNSKNHRQRSNNQSVSCNNHHPLGARIRKPLMEGSLNIINQLSHSLQCSGVNNDEKMLMSNCVGDDYIGGWRQYGVQMGRSVGGLVDSKQVTKNLLSQQVICNMDRQITCKTVRPKLIQSVCYNNMNQPIKKQVGKQQLNQHRISNTNINTNNDNDNYSDELSDVSRIQKGVMISVEQYRELQERLEMCLQEMRQLQTNSPTSTASERITQLQNQIKQMKLNHQEEKQQLTNRIEQQQEKENQLMIKIASLQGKLIEKQQSSSSKQQHSNNITKSDINSYSQQIGSLKEQLSLLTSYNHNQSQLSSNINIPVSIASNSLPLFHSIKESVNIQNFVHEIQILKRKMLTLQQMLSTKRTQITNKDKMIKLLIKQKTISKLQQTTNYHQQQINEQQKLNYIIESVYSYIEIQLQQL